MKITLQFDGDNEFENREQAIQAMRSSEYIAAIEDILNYLRSIDKYGAPADWDSLNKEEVISLIRQEVLDRVSDLDLY